jgi:cytochrome c-type biogenesis protein CcmF
MLKVWNASLVLTTGILAVLGTFLVRSGILDSIHAFGASTLGIPFVTLIALMIGGSVALVVTRRDSLRSEHQLDSLLSREAVFLGNNLVLVGLAFVVFWGTFFPLISEAVTGTKSAVGPPWFDRYTVPLALVLVLLSGIGPVVAWRRASLRSLGRSFAWPGAIAGATGAVLLLLGAGSSRVGLVAYTFSAFVLGSIGYEFVRGTRARRALIGGSWANAFAELVARNRRRYGGYVVHASIVLLAIGVAGSSAYDTVRERMLNPGQTMAVGSYDLTYERLVRREGQNADEARAVLAVRKGGDSVGTLEAGKNRYRAEDQVSNEVGIRSDYLTGEDLFVITDQINTNGTVVFKVLVKPLVNLIWLAGLVFLIGSLIALWPSAAEQRRLAERYRELRALARA